MTESTRNDMMLSIKQPLVRQNVNVQLYQGEGQFQIMLT